MNVGLGLIKIRRTIQTIKLAGLGMGARWDILEGQGGGSDWFLSQLLKCINIVFHGENVQNKNILIIFSFTNIVFIVACNYL